MDFFERQHAARNASFRLVFLFTLSVLLIVAGVDAIAAAVVLGQHGSIGSAVAWMIATTAITLLIIGGGTLSKMVALRAGGAAVAESVGATAIDTTTTDPQLRRFVNVVEEMSIASGVPMPRLFVLEKESSINAFAAGYSPADAAVTVTGGALQRLNRDELQGVIGHEFSHVLNGDMRLNVRLIGLLNGILLLGLVGLRVLAFGPRGSDRKNNAAGVILLVGLAMLVLGFIGQFFAGLIQAGVARQREWLADASSVQFTRQPVGLAGALKKIAGLPAGSALQNSHSEKQISHMLFGEGRKRISSLYATHPPLLKRITALEPTFDAAEVEQLQQEWAVDPPDALREDARLGLVGASGGGAVQARPAVQVDPASLAARVGTFTPEDLDRGAALSGQIPPNFRQLASQPSTVVPLVLALLLDSGTDVRARQLNAIAARTGQAEASAADELAAQLGALPPLLRLPLVGISAATLVARPADQVRTLVRLLDELARTDGVVTVFEYCLTRLVSCYARDALEPATRSRPGRSSVAGQQDAALTLLAVVAAAGNPDPAAAAHAFAAAAQRLMPGRPVPPFAPPPDRVAALDGVWDALDRLDARHKQPLIEALVAAVSDDGLLAVAEAELLRTSCALLHCPLPALLA